MTSRDPVCSRQVDFEQHHYKIHFNGKDIMFCSADCLEQFEAMPALFMPESHTG